MSTHTMPKIKRLLVLLRDAERKQMVPIGQLTHHSGQPKPYEFRYLRGIERAREFGFTELPAFPDIKKVYKSEELFSFFRNRLTSSQRMDYGEYLSLLCLPPNTKDEMTILGRSGGVRMTDSIEVFAEPAFDENRIWESQFWVEDAREELPPTVGVGATLRIEGQRLYANGCGDIGKLPDVLHAAVESAHEWLQFPAFTEEDGPAPKPSEEDLQSQLKLEVSVEYLASKSVPDQYRILCLLRMVCPDGLPVPLSTLDAYQPLTQVSPRPRFVVGAQRTEPALERLLIRFSEGEIPQLPTFAKPMEARCVGTVQDLRDARLSLGEDGKLAFSGSDENGFKLIEHDLSASREDADQPHRLRRGTIALDLHDGARVEEVFAGCQRNFSINEQGGGAQWSIKLADWTYTQGASVRYWVGVVREGELPHTQNLVVRSSRQIGWAGLHAPGHRSLTLLHQFGSRDPTICYYRASPDARRTSETTRRRDGEPNLSGRSGTRRCLTPSGDGRSREPGCCAGPRPNVPGQP